MTWQNPLLVGIIGLVLRIGIPVVLTAGVVYLLRRLDNRWREEALAVPLATATHKPCWEIMKCPAEKRKSCPVAAKVKVPCWQYFRAKNGVLREACLSCDVFLQAPVLV